MMDRRPCPGRSSVRGRWIALVTVTGLMLCAASASLACRFWAAIGSGVPDGAFEDQLRSGTITNLKDLGTTNRNGWGFASFPTLPGLPCLNEPVVRRGRPPATWLYQNRYDAAVDEVICLRPRAVLGHVRGTASGQEGIPDPHPFLQERWIFAQNGAMPAATLDSLLSWDDIHYLNEHPTEYVNGYIDSELFFLYLLKVVHRSPQPIEQSLVQAVADVARVTGGSKRLNFVMTAGDTLYALRYAAGDSADPVVYSPVLGSGAGTRASSWFVVASQVMGSSSSAWGAMPERSLGVFVPGRPPRFLPVDYSASIPESPRGPAERPRPAVSDDGVWIGESAPSPTGGEIYVTLRLREPASVGAEIHGPDGRLVRSLTVGFLPAGEHRIRWDGLDDRGRRVASGAYYCRIRAGRSETARRVTVVR